MSRRNSIYSSGGSSMITKTHCLARSLGDHVQTLQQHQHTHSLRRIRAGIPEYHKHRTTYSHNAYGRLYTRGVVVASAAAPCTFSSISCQQFSEHPPTHLFAFLSLFCSCTLLPYSALLQVRMSCGFGFVSRVGLSFGGVSRQVSSCLFFPCPSSLSNDTLAARQAILLSNPPCREEKREKWELFCERGFSVRRGCFVSFFLSSQNTVHLHRVAAA